MLVRNTAKQTRLNAGYGLSVWKPYPMQIFFLNVDSLVSVIHINEHNIVSNSEKVVQTASQCILVYVSNKNRSKVFL